MSQPDGHVKLSLESMAAAPAVRPPHLTGTAQIHRSLKTPADTGNMALKPKLWAMDTEIKVATPAEYCSPRPLSCPVRTLVTCAVPGLEREESTAVGHS